MQKVIKAVIAFLGPIGLTLAAIATDPRIVDVFPAQWVVVLTAVAAVIAGVVAFLARNEQTFDSIDTAVAKGDITLSELNRLLTKWKQRSNELPGANP